MKTIPDAFTQDGLHFTLLERNGDVAVYRRQNQKHVIYEIMTVDGSSVSGTGWMFKSLRKALDMMEECVRTNTSTSKADGGETRVDTEGSIGIMGNKH